MDTFLRTTTLAIGALLCALLAGLLALYTLTWSLPPSDSAYGMSVADSLRDPFILLAWGPLVLGGAAIGFAFSRWLLWRVTLLKAIPTVAAVTAVGAAASAPIFYPLSPLVALSVGVMAMFWCRQRTAWQSDRSRPRSGPPPAADR